jgi:2'-aminobiphenyl-2,3-diol 1,2-dioxygenase large subunit
MSPDGLEARAERVFDGMREVGRRVQAVAPDVLLVISGDHMFNIHMGLQVPLCIGVADSWTPFGDMGIERRPFPGHRALAEHLVERAAADGFDIAKAEELEPDHGIALPLLFADPGRRIPVVPVLVNVNMSPLPQPGRCYRLGQVLRSAIESFGGPGSRVAVIGTGGLSHWLCVPRMGEVAAEFDRMVINEIIAGRAERLAQMSAAEVVARAGNGGIEIVTWLMAAATLPGRSGTAVYYEPMPEWLTGMGGVAIAA